MARKQIIGMVELERALTKDFPRNLLNNIRRQMEKSADALVADLKLRAPVYDGPMTERRWKGRVYPVVKGALRDSIE